MQFPAPIKDIPTDISGCCWHPGLINMQEQDGYLALLLDCVLDNRWEKQERSRNSQRNQSHKTSTIPLKHYFKHFRMRSICHVSPSTDGCITSVITPVGRCYSEVRSRSRRRWGPCGWGGFALLLTYAAACTVVNCIHNMQRFSLRSLITWHPFGRLHSKRLQRDPTRFKAFALALTWFFSLCYLYHHFL